MRAQAPAADAEMAAFAASRPKRGPVCWVCTLPPASRKRIETARAADPVTWTMRALSEFMRLHMGLPQATYSRLRDHFQNHVERANG